MKRHPKGADEPGEREQLQLMCIVESRARIEIAASGSVALY